MRLQLIFELAYLSLRSSILLQASGVVNKGLAGSDRLQLKGSHSDYNILGNTIALAGSADLIATIQGNFNPSALIFV